MVDTRLQALEMRLMVFGADRQDVRVLVAQARSWDGYIREDAVRQLGESGHPAAIPELLIRANDWVPQVRRASRLALIQLQTPDNVLPFIWCLPALYHLQTCSRENHETLIALTERFLLASEHRQTLVSEITNEDYKVARCAFTLVVNHHLLPLEKQVSIGLGHYDEIIRLMASRQLRALQPDCRLPLIEMAMCDTFLPVRREGFQWYLKQHPQQQSVIPFLFDRHTSIREIAVHYLQQQAIEVTSIYRQALNEMSVHRVKCAVWGLRYLGSREDIDKIRLLRCSSSPSIRAQVLLYLSQVCDDEALLPWLLDASSQVTKVALTRIRRSNLVVNADDWMHLTAQCSSPQSLLRCGALLTDMNKWEQLIVLLQLRIIPQRVPLFSAEHMSAVLKRWNQNFNQDQSQPTHLQIMRLDGLYQAGKGLIRFDPMVLFTLRSLGITTE